jgi:GNAT superfamily N-acetyltransferase
MPTLHKATDAEKKARDPLTRAEWGQGLSAEQWLEREAVLRAHPWSVAMMETWFLKDGERTLASCETFRIQGRCGDSLGDVYAIASVFTEPELRGKGYATTLIDALNAMLQQRENALGSCLFSDVGARLYQRSGYRAFPAFEWVLKPEAGDPEKDTRPLDRPIELVLGAAQPEVLALYARVEQFDWHLERERFYAHALGRSPAPFHAAQKGSAFVSWMASYKENVLRVLGLEPGTPEDTAAVLRTAQRMAHALRLDSVRVWEPHPGFPALPGERRPREGELPMARIYGRERFDWRQVHRVVWV